MFFHSDVPDPVGEGAREFDGVASIVPGELGEDIVFFAVGLDIGCEFAGLGGGYPELEEETKLISLLMLLFLKELLDAGVPILTNNLSNSL